jgi:arabinofuranosyltransferase
MITELEMMATKQLRKKYFIAILIFFVGYCLFLSWSFLFQNVDDAYISFRYGRNMMKGLGLVYNGGEYVEGYTNFLWTVITGPFTVIDGIDISVFALSFGLIISILNIFMLYRLLKLFPEVFSEVPMHIFLLPIIFFVLDDSIAFWAIGGMEFPIYTLFILGILYNYFKLNSGPKYLYRMLAFMMLCTMTRPEGNMIFVITVFHMLLSRKKFSNFRGDFIKAIAAYALFFAVYYGFKHYYYGNFIPNTFYAKGVTDLTMNFYLGAKYLAMCIGTRLYIFVFILFIPFKKAFSDFKQSYLILFCITYILYLIGVGGDWMIANRFFVPILPLLYVLSTIGFVYAVKKLMVSYRNSVSSFHMASGTAVVILSVLLFFTTLAFLEYKQLIIKDENARYEMQWSMFGKWLKMNTDPETIIAVGPAGKIPYYSELYTIDMWGLNNEYIAKTSSKRLQAGHKKFDFEYVLSLNPEFIIGYAGFADSDMPYRYMKFNTQDEKYRCFDVVFRLSVPYRTYNKQ